MSPDQIKATYERHKARAVAATKLFNKYCDKPMSRVPGMDTKIRMAVRLHYGKSLEEAAAAEYAYRWHLALTSRICFGVPHTLGL